MLSSAIVSGKGVLPKRDASIGEELEQYEATNCLLDYASISQTLICPGHTWMVTPTGDQKIAAQAGRLVRPALIY